MCLSVFCYCICSCLCRCLSLSSHLFCFSSFHRMADLLPCQLAELNPNIGVYLGSRRAHFPKKRMHVVTERKVLFVIE